MATRRNRPTRKKHRRCTPKIVARRAAQRTPPAEATRARRSAAGDYTTRAMRAKPTPGAQAKELLRRSFATATATQRAHAMARLPIVTAVTMRPRWQSMNAAVTEVCKTQRGPDGETLTQSTVRQWVALFVRHGRDGLVRQHRSDNGTRRATANTNRQRGYSEAALDEMMRDVLCTTGGSAHALWKALQKRWPRMHFAKKSVDRWARRWKKENAHLLLMATQGEGRFQDLATLHLGWLPITPLTLSVLDSTQLDLWVRVIDRAHAKGYFVIRPWVTLMLDVGSRAALTFEVTVNRPNSGTVLSLLRRAWAKDANWRGLPRVPVPQRFHVDAGSEHKGEFQQALKTLGLDKRMVAGPPERQPHIERAVNTVFAEEAVSGQIGHSKVDRPAGRTDRSTREHARGKESAQRERLRTERDPVDFLTLDELIEHLLGVVHRYNDRMHGGLVQQARNADAARRAA